MTLAEFITGLEDWVDSLERYERDVSPLTCCDHRELETVQDILTQARAIKENS